MKEMETVFVILVLETSRYGILSQGRFTKFRKEILELNETIVH